MLAVLDACDVSSAAVVAHDWGAVAGWGLAAFAPDRVERFAALSVGHPKAFVDAGFAQRMRSLYMLLFNIPVVAEQWMSMFGEQMLASHADRAAVLAELAEPGAMTAGFGWYRANASPKTIVSPPPELPPVACPVTGVWSSNDIALTEQQMIGSQDYVDGPWRYERIEGAGPLDAARRPRGAQPDPVGVPELTASAAPAAACSALAAARGRARSSDAAAPRAAGSVSPNAISANGTALRNTTCSESLNAIRSPSRTRVGQLLHLGRVGRHAGAVQRRAAPSAGCAWAGWPPAGC